MNSSLIQSVFHIINATPILFHPSRKLTNIWCYSSVSQSHSNNLKSSTRIPAKFERFNEVSPNDVPKVDVLKQKVELLGIVYDSSSVPGRYYNLLCPKCEGGQSVERSLSFHIVPNGDFAMWRCFRFDCGWAGRVFTDDRAEDERTERKFKSARQLTEQTLGLVPLGDELIAYFHDRMISMETLRRNGVMQLCGNKLIIAFTYRRNGLLVGCKYRTVEKRFWQEKDTEKVLYGLDDIVDGDEIIIVEGELDKLSVEEAGFRNCDTAFQYLWNCKHYLDKASRIILATDGDPPGQALAEELARRLGKERCWQVSWPKKDEYSYFKDANEVLRRIGPIALKNIIENAVLYNQSMADQEIKDI